jgi:hypothetical protein
MKQPLLRKVLQVSSIAAQGVAVVCMQQSWKSDHDMQKFIHAPQTQNHLNGALGLLIFCTYHFNELFQITLKLQT